MIDLVMGGVIALVRGLVSAITTIDLSHRLTSREARKDRLRQAYNAFCVTASEWAHNRGQWSMPLVMKLSPVAPQIPAEMMSDLQSTTDRLAEEARIARIKLIAARIGVLVLERRASRPTRIRQIGVKLEGIGRFLVPSETKSLGQRWLRFTEQLRELISDLERSFEEVADDPYLA